MSRIVIVILIHNRNKPINLMDLCALLSHITLRIVYMGLDECGCWYMHQKLWDKFYFGPQLHNIRFSHIKPKSKFPSLLKAMEQKLFTRPKYGYQYILNEHLSIG
jgi:hypothetical protein